MRNVLLSLVLCVSLSLSHAAFAIDDVTSENIEEKLGSHDLAVVEVYRPGCEFCLKMYPVLSRFEAANPSTPLYRILVTDEGFKAKYKVSDIPAFLVFKRGQFSHAFFGLMDSDEFYQSVYFAPVAVRDPQSVVYGLKELMGDLLPDYLKLVKVKDGFYAVMNPDETVGYAKVFLDGSVLDASGSLIGKIHTSVSPGACCSHGK